MQFLLNLKFHQKDIEKLKRSFFHVINEALSMNHEFIIVSNQFSAAFFSSLFVSRNQILIDPSIKSTLSKKGQKIAQPLHPLLKNQLKIVLKINKDTCTTYLLSGSENTWHALKRRGVIKKNYVILGSELQDLTLFTSAKESIYIGRNHYLASFAHWQIQPQHLINTLSIITQRYRIYNHTA